MNATSKYAKPKRYVGIMVCETPGNPPFPEKSFYRSLSLLGLRLGLVVFVFFPHRIDWQRNRAVGYAFSPEQKRWNKGFFPLPDVVYDRCFYSSKEKFETYREPIRRLLNRPGTRFLGHGLKGKWSVHQMLIRDEALRPHLPETERLEGADGIMRWLDEKGELFLKPHGGSQGKGVLHIARLESGLYEVRGRDARNAAVHATFRNADRLLTWVGRFVAGRTYLIQRYLPLTTETGEAFDIRALVQKNRNGRWELTGMAVRHGKPGSVTSNLHGGGYAEDVAPFLRKRYGAEKAADIMATLGDIAHRVPDTLEQYHGRLVELGLDIGVDPEGNVWILEVNSKPGRSAFAALSDKSARASAIRNPILYARYLLDTTRRVTS